VTWTLILSRPSWEYHWIRNGDWNKNLLCADQAYIFNVKNSYMHSNLLIFNYYCSRSSSQYYKVFVRENVITLTLIFTILCYQVKNRTN